MSWLNVTERRCSLANSNAPHINIFMPYPPILRVRPSTRPPIHPLTPRTPYADCSLHRDFFAES